jgi:chromosome segregation ATPase|tara:strand:- start:9245 stop:10099 length:855 start_codon:yes stop_codon:yes gene_type:complete
MILQSFTTAVSQATLAVEAAKTKAQAAGSNSKAGKLFKSQIESKLPQPSSIKEQLTTQINKPDDLKEIERKFKLIKRKCENVRGMLGGKKDQINQVKSEIDKVTNVFDRLNVFIEEGTKYLPTILLLITTGKVGLNLLPLSTPVGSPVPGSGGSGIIKLSDGIKKAESKINEFDAIISSLGSVKDYIQEQTKPISDQCNSALEVITNIDNKIQITCDYADQTYLQILTFYSNLLDNDTITEETTIQFDNPEEILNNLEDSNKPKFFEFMENLKTRETGYRIIKK